MSLGFLLPEMSLTMFIAKLLPRLVKGVRQRSMPNAGWQIPNKRLLF